MSKLVTLRNVSGLRFVDVPILGRQGDAPSYADCEACLNPDHPDHDPTGSHEHTELVNEEGGKPGSGCLVPGEEFDTTPEIAVRLLEQVRNFEAVSPKRSATEKKG